MKLLKTKKLLLGTLTCLALVSCKKDKTTSPETPVSAELGTLMLHFHTNVDTTEVDAYNKVYGLANGRKISVSLAQMYISGIQLVKTDGTTYDIIGLNILKVMEVEQYLAGNVPAGNYKSIRFNVGLSEGTNTSTPAASDSTLNKPLMWFGNSAQAQGFVFINFSGKIDTTSNANGSIAQMQPFIYKIGTNAHLKNIVMPDRNYSVANNQTQFIHIVINYAELLNGIKLNVPANLSVSTISDNTGAVANQITNNMPGMFSYEN